MLVSLKARLGVGAGLIALVAVLASILTVYGARVISDRITDALDAQRRIEGFSTLAAQISGFAVLTVEAERSGATAAARLSRLEAMQTQIGETFDTLSREIEASVLKAEDLGVDEQTRRATRGIGLARMRALYEGMATAVTDGGADAPLRAQLDSFSTRFAPLLDEAIAEENRIRAQAVAAIGRLRGQVIRAALAVAAIAAGLYAIFYFGLVAPMFARLDRLRDAARRIADQDFRITLPEGRADEVGSVLAETNRLAQALGKRQGAVEADRARLNEIIAEQTRDLQDANDQLAKIDEDRQRFFADFSHELRTPLTVILMESELGLRGADAKPAFSVIQSRARRLNRRIDDLLRVARSETGRIGLDVDSFDLAAAAREAARDTKRLAERAQMTVTACSDNEIMVRGDENWTRQIVEGLIENAIKHARSGGTVKVLCDRVDGRGQVHVTDNGEGIGPDHAPHIFDRFRQGGTAGHRAGFGIGLALARWVIEEQGGTISVQSPVPDTDKTGDNPGTRVTLSLPEVPAATDQGG